jgi:RNA polymerase sigma factor (TIGR02999 family)
MADADPSTAGDVTLLLQRSRTGDPDAASALFERLYAELHERARLVAAGRDGTLHPTALVHEAWLKLVPERQPAFADRLHFLRTAAAAMRSVLIDHCRAKATQKRHHVVAPGALDQVAESYAGRGVDLLVLDEALQRLAGLDPELAQVVDLRFFAGLGMAEVAEAMQVSLSSAERMWRLARAWLQTELRA